VVSVTTDGFITDLENLETKLLFLPEEYTTLLRKYRAIRTDLSGVSDALEVKSDGKGIISWTTRGQLGIDSKIVAATGFQRAGFDKNELVTLFKNTLSKENKLFEFTRKSLRSAKDIFEKGGQVTEVLKDQTFRLFYDNRREIIEPTDLQESFNLSNVLLDSNPLANINICKTFRFLSKFPITIPYNKNNANRSSTLYKSKLEVGVRNFIKAYYCTNEKFGLKGNEFKFIWEMISFINGFESTKDIKISISSISKLKNRRLI